MLTYTRILTFALVLLACSLVAASEARANPVTIDTSTTLLDSSNFTAGTTYYLAFQLTGGGTDNNSILLNNFSFGGGAIVARNMGDPEFGTYLLGANAADPSGIGQALASLQLVITPGDAFSLYTQQLIAGSSLSFDFTPTNNFAFGSFDQFAFQIYDATLTTLLFEFTFDINGVVEPVPEPATGALLGMGIFAASAYLRRRRKQPRGATS